TQEGTYWFRRAKHKPRERVTIKSNKALFESGTASDLADVKGQWRGPTGTEHRRDNNQTEEKSGFLKKIYNQLPGLFQLPVLFVGISGALLTPILLDRCSIMDSRLVHGGPPPLKPEYTDLKILPNGLMEYHIKHGVRLKNNGWRRGHVDKVELSSDGLNEFPE